MRFYYLSGGGSLGQKRKGVEKDPNNRLIDSELNKSRRSKGEGHSNKKERGWKNDPNNRLIDIEINKSRRSKKRAGESPRQKRKGVKK